MTLEMISQGRWLGRYSRQNVLPPLWQGLKAVYRLLLPNQGWVTFLLLLLVAISVSGSVESAKWTTTPGLAFVVFTGLVTGLATAKLRVHGLILQGLSLSIGFLTILWLLVRLVDAGTWGEGMKELAERLGVWFDAAVTDGISTDPLVFAMVLMVLTWLLGYVCGWFAFRYRNIWVPLIMAGIGILTNLSYLPSYQWSFFFLFLIFAMLAVAWMSIVDRHTGWSQQRIRHSLTLGAFGMYDALWFGLIVIVVATLLPTGLPRPSFLKRGYEYLRWPVEEFRGDFTRLFAGIPARKPLAYRLFDTTLPFQGIISLSDEVVFTLKSSRPSYWRVRSYPTYTSRGWVSGDSQIVPMKWQPEGAVPLLYQRQEPVVQRVELNYRPRLLAAAGVVQESDIGLVVEIPVLPTHTITLTGPFADMSLPPDVRDLAQRLSNIAEEGEALTEARIQDALPGGLELVSVEADKTVSLVGITVRRPIPVPLDVLSIRSQKVLFSSDVYTVTSLVSVATAEELRKAGEEYPGWVQDLYLQLPDTLPQRVIDLAHSLTAEAETPYDKALAIRDYLRTLPYRTDIPPPAFDADGVDHFLFGVREGYSDYFASAMAVMLRAVGVPTRLEVGYGFGEAEGGRVVVRDRNSHAWTGVFFPSYGWVDFEPTSGREPPVPIREAGATDELSPAIGGLDDEFLDYDLDGLGGSLDRGWLDRNPGLAWLLWLALGVVVVGVASLSLVGIRWLLGSPAAAMGVYGKMARLSAIIGLGPYVSQTPHEYGRGLAMRLPEIQPEVTAVVVAYSKGRYGNRALSESEEARVMEAWRAIRRILFVRLLRRRRWKRGM